MLYYLYDNWSRINSLVLNRDKRSFFEFYFSQVSGSLIVLGGRDGGSQPMALGDMEQLEVESK